MTQIMISMNMAIVIPLILMVMCTMISKIMSMDREKMTPFECEFDPK